MKTFNTYVELLCQEKDSLDYTTYVFKILDSEDTRLFDQHYLMCTRWPNWDHRELLNGERGYLSCTEIIAGEDLWYNPNSAEKIPYKSSTVQFNKFIREQPKQTKHSFKL